MDFSIVLCTYNREETYLKNCICSLLKLIYPRDKYEIIIIDSNSDNRVSEVLNILLSKDTPNIQLIKRKKKTSSAIARAIGTFTSNAKYIAFTDDDCIVTKDWLSKFRKRLRIESCDGIGGTIFPARISTFCERFCDFDKSLESPIVDNSGNITSIITANACFRKKSLLQAIGKYYDEYRQLESNEIFPCLEDYIITQELITRNLKVVHEASAIVYHYHPETVTKKIRQFFWYGQGMGIFCSVFHVPPNQIKGGYKLPNIPSTKGFIIIFLKQINRIIGKIKKCLIQKRTFLETLTFPAFCLILQLSYYFGFLRILSKLNKININKHQE